MQLRTSAALVRDDSLIREDVLKSRKRNGINMLAVFLKISQKLFVKDVLQLGILRFVIDPAFGKTSIQRCIVTSILALEPRPHYHQ